MKRIIGAALDIAFFTLGMITFLKLGIKIPHDTSLIVGVISGVLYGVVKY